MWANNHICIIFCSLFLALASILTLPAIAPASKERAGLKSIGEGLRATWKNINIRAAIFTDIIATFFALPIALLPEYSDKVLSGGAETYGWLLAAISIGGATGTILSGWLNTIVKKTRTVIIVASLWCVLIALLGLTTLLVPALIILFLAGIADVWSLIIQQTIIQDDAPADKLGRIGSIQGLSAMAGPELGNFRAGAMGSLLGPQMAIFIGAVTALPLIGLVCALPLWRSEHRSKQ